MKGKLHMIRQIFESWSLITNLCQFERSITLPRTAAQVLNSTMYNIVCGFLFLRWLSKVLILTLPTNILYHIVKQCYLIIITYEGKSCKSSTILKALLKLEVILIHHPCCLGVVLPSCRGVFIPDSLFFNLAHASAALRQSIGSLTIVPWGGLQIQ